MGTVTITINGQKVSAHAGQTVLEAARGAGIDIPTLCHHPALAPAGACRVCLVEVSGQRTLQPACTFPATERMEVQTESAKVVAARRFVLELIFSERNHFCMTCPMSGDCQLQELGYRYGLDHWVYPTYEHRFAVDASPAHHLLDHNRCVLCRRCVRACAELVGNHTLDLRQRGAQTMLCADMDVPLAESTCVGCGTCVEVCPTGALIEKRSAFMARPAELERIATTCSQCSLGCGLNVAMHRGQVLRLESLWEAPVNRGLLCRRGRFEALEDHRPRILAPMLNDGGERLPVSWEKALAEAAARLQATDPLRLGLMASTRMTNEALMLAKKIFLDTLNAGQRGMVDGVCATFPTAERGRLADLCASDAILLAGTDPSADQPVAAFLIKRAVDRGARLITAGKRPGELAAFAEMHVVPRQLEVAVDALLAAARPMVVYGSGLKKADRRTLQRLAGRARFLALQPGVNTRTASAVDVNGTLEPTGCDTLFVIAGEENGTMEALAAGIDRRSFVIAQACYDSPLAARADLLLPMATWLERSGTLTNTEGSLCRAHAALPPSGQSRPDWDILGRLAETLGLEDDPGLKRPERRTRRTP
ncbi:MAG: molybdopterin-dependent oxidoreductase [Desulfobacterales bacterium]|jgi:formate dehydrogenase major subunit|nr:molybdopterin-dependent oxidoreductase [Desulfobacterales bacterium]